MKPVLSVIAVAMSVVMSAGPAWSYNDQDRAREGVRSGEFQSLSRIKRDLENQFHGRVLDVQLVPDRSGRGTSYDVKMLTPDGDILEVETDAKTGRIKGVKGRR